MIKVYCYSRCSTCKKALKWLDEKGIEYDLADIKEDHPGEEELREYFSMSGLPLKRFFNTSGMQYRELGLSKKLPDMSEDEQLALLATDGMLVKRPLVDGEKQLLQKGDSTFIAPHAVHSAVAHADSLIIDMFAPMREDFLE